MLTFGVGMTLRDGDRQYFYEQLDKHFPGMKDKYIRTFGNAYEIPSPNHAYLWKLIRETCRRTGMESNTDKLFSYLHEFEDKEAGQQLTLC